LKLYKSSFWNNNNLHFLSFGLASVLWIRIPNGSSFNWISGSGYIRAPKNQKVIAVFENWMFSLVGWWLFMEIGSS
jgi:hypothetical protein